MVGTSEPYLMDQAPPTERHVLQPVDGSKDLERSGNPQRSRWKLPRLVTTFVKLQFRGCNQLVKWKTVDRMMAMMVDDG